MRVLLPGTSKMTLVNVMTCVQLMRVVCGTVRVFCIFIKNGFRFQNNCSMFSIFSATHVSLMVHACT